MKKKEIAKYDYFDIVLGRKILGIVKMADKKQKSDTIRETKYVYDTKNRLVSYTDPEGRTETYTYDCNSNLTKTVDKNGNTLKNTYDNQNRLTERTAKEKKTGKEKLFPVNRELAAAIEDYCKDKKDYDYLVPSARAVNKAVSREYAYRVIHEAGQHFGLDNLGTHTMRKTFGYHFYLQTKDIVLLMRIFNHNDESKTLRYIGIEQTTIDAAMMKFSYKK